MLFRFLNRTLDALTKLSVNIDVQCHNWRPLHCPTHSWPQQTADMWWYEQRASDWTRQRARARTVQYSTVQYSGQDRSEVQSWNSSPSDFRLNFRIWRVLWSELMVYYWWCNISSPGLSSDIKSFMGTQSNCLDWNYRSLSLSWILIIIFIGWRKLNIYYFSTSFIPRFSFNSIVNMRTVILPRIWKCISKYLHEIILISIIIYLIKTWTI